MDDNLSADVVLRVAMDDNLSADLVPCLQQWMISLLADLVPYVYQWMKVCRLILCPVDQRMAT
jgi:hypothetical protein